MTNGQLLDLLKEVEKINKMNLMLSPFNIFEQVLLSRNNQRLLEIRYILETALSAAKSREG